MSFDLVDSGDDGAGVQEEGEVGLGEIGDADGASFAGLKQLFHGELGFGEAGVAESECSVFGKGEEFGAEGEGAGCLLAGWSETWKTSNGVSLGYVMSSLEIRGIGTWYWKGYSRRPMHQVQIHILKPQIL